MDFLRMQYAMNESIKIVFNRYAFFFETRKLMNFMEKSIQINTNR